MKKFLSTIICISLLALVVVFAVPQRTFADESEGQSAVTLEGIDKLTEEICGIENRTAFTDACKSAADSIKNKLVGYGLTTAEVQSYDVIQEGLFGMSSTTYKSYNVIASTGTEGKKSIVIATDFSNHFAQNPMGKGTGATGALESATTTALVLKLAEYLAAQPNNEYNFIFAFFSGTEEGNYGSELFIDNNPNLMKDIILMINLERLGGGNIYYYTDEVATSHGKFIDKLFKSKVAPEGYKLKKFPVTGRVLLEGGTVDGLNYSHYAMYGNNASFMSEGKACLEFLGGDFSGLGMNDGKGFSIGTANDTYENLTEIFPDYAQKLAFVGQSIIELVGQPELQSVCLGAAKSYKIFTEGWVACVICLGIIVILLLILILVTKKLEKKYPVPAQPKLNIAVFGSEYEEPKDNEIIVDIKRKEDDDDSDPFGL